MNNTQLNLNQYRTSGNETIITIVIITALIILIPLLSINALDKHIENQDTMLCKSALKSRNQEYLSKCDCYYKTQNIICLQGEDN
jgi:hypothetical protein